MNGRIILKRGEDQKTLQIFLPNTWMAPLIYYFTILKKVLKEIFIIFLKLIIEFDKNWLTLRQRKLIRKKIKTGKDFKENEKLTQWIRNPTTFVECHVIAPPREDRYSHPSSRFLFGYGFSSSTIIPFLSSFLQQIAPWI